LNFYQPLVLDLKVLQQYCEEVVVAKFLPVLDTSLGNQIRKQMLGGNTVPSLSTTLSRVRRVFMRGDSFSGSLGIQNSAMVAEDVAEVEDVDTIVAAIQVEDVDMKIRVNIIVRSLW